MKPSTANSDSISLLSEQVGSDTDQSSVCDKTAIRLSTPGEEYQDYSCARENSCNEECSTSCTEDLIYAGNQVNTVVTHGSCSTNQTNVETVSTTFSKMTAGHSDDDTNNSKCLSNHVNNAKDHSDVQNNTHHVSHDLQDSIDNGQLTLQLLEECADNVKSNSQTYCQDSDEEQETEETYSDCIENISDVSDTYSTLYVSPNKDFIKEHPLDVINNITKLAVSIPKLNADIPRDSANETECCTHDDVSTIEQQGNPSNKSLHCQLSSVDSFEDEVFEVNVVDTSSEIILEDNNLDISNTKEKNLSEGDIILVDNRTETASEMCANSEISNATPIIPCLANKSSESIKSNVKPDNILLISNGETSSSQSDFETGNNVNPGYAKRSSPVTSNLKASKSTLSPKSKPFIPRNQHNSTSEHLTSSDENVIKESSNCSSKPSSLTNSVLNPVAYTVEPYIPKPSVSPCLLPTPNIPRSITPTRAPILLPTPKIFSHRYPSIPTCEKQHSTLLPTPAINKKARQTAGSFKHSPGCALFNKPDFSKPTTNKPFTDNDKTNRRDPQKSCDKTQPSAKYNLHSRKQNCDHAFHHDKEYLKAKYDPKYHRYFNNNDVFHQFPFRGPKERGRLVSRLSGHYNAPYGYHDVDYYPFPNQLLSKRHKADYDDRNVRNRHLDPGVFCDFDAGHNYYDEFCYNEYYPLLCDRNRFENRCGLYRSRSAFNNFRYLRGNRKNGTKYPEVRDIDNCNNSNANSWGCATTSSSYMQSSRQRGERNGYKNASNRGTNVRGGRGKAVSNTRNKLDNGESILHKSDNRSKQTSIADEQSKLSMKCKQPEVTKVELEITPPDYDASTELLEAQNLEDIEQIEGSGILHSHPSKMESPHSPIQEEIEEGLQEDFQNVVSGSHTSYDNAIDDAQGNVILDSTGEIRTQEHVSVDNFIDAIPNPPAYVLTPEHQAHLANFTPVPFHGGAGNDVTATIEIEASKFDEAFSEDNSIDFNHEDVTHGTLDAFETFVNDGGEEEGHVVHLHINPGTTVNFTTSDGREQRVSGKDFPQLTSIDLLSINSACSLILNVTAIHIASRSCDASGPHIASRSCDAYRNFPVIPGNLLAQTNLSNMRMEL